MTSEEVVHGPLVAYVRECWIDAADKRLSGDFASWTDRPTIHAIAVESVRVDLPHRRQGHCKRFLALLCADPRFDMVVVEAVGNRRLAEYLLREGWECQPDVMDFYRARVQP